MSASLPNCIKLAALLLLTTLSLSTHAQKLWEDTLSANPYYLEGIEGTLKGKPMHVFVLRVLPIPAKHRMIRALYCKDSTLAFNSYHTPPSCVDWVPFEETGDRVTEYGENGRTEVKPDSSKVINKQCLFDFYATNNDSVQVDTIYVERKDLAYSKINYLSSCPYVKDLKQGKETVYYEIHQLKGQCISNYNRIKMEGNWQKGKRVGEWYYYDVNGKLLKTELYKKGRLKSTREHE